MYTSFSEARMALDEAKMDCAADFGDEGVEAGYRDIVYAIAESCVPEVRDELLRREGYGG